MSNYVVILSKNAQKQLDKIPLHIVEPILQGIES